MSRTIVPVNGSDRDWTRHRYVLWFGACAPTRLMIWANGLESAIEIAGHIMPEGSEELAELRKEACEEAGLPYPPTCDHSELEEEGYYAAFESAEADLTYTESGYLTSYEWGIDLEDPTRAQVLELQAAIA